MPHEQSHTSSSPLLTLNVSAYLLLTSLREQSSDFGLGLHVFKNGLLSANVLDLEDSSRTKDRGLDRPRKSLTLALASTPRPVVACNNALCVIILFA